MKRPLGRMFARVLVLQLCRFELERAVAVYALLEASSCTTERDMLREEWRRREEDVSLRELESVRQLNTNLGDMLRSRLSELEIEDHIREDLCLQSWGAPLPLTVSTLRHLVDISRVYFDAVISFRANASCAGPDPMLKPSVVVEGLNAKRLRDIRTKFSASLLQAWIRRLLRSSKEAKILAASTIAKVLKPSIQRRLAISALRGKHGSKRIQQWYRRRRYVRCMLVKYCARVRAEGHAYKRILVGRNRTWQALRCHSGLAQDWLAAQRIQAVIRGRLDRLYAARLRLAYSSISRILVGRYLHRKKLRGESFLVALQEESERQKHWRQVRRSFAGLHDNILDGSMLNLQVATEVNALERSKLQNIRSCTSRFNQFKHAMKQSAPKEKLPNGWVYHSCNDRGEEQYLNMQTGRVQSEHPNLARVKLKLTKEAAKAQKALQEHLTKISQLTHTITANESQRRERLFTSMAVVMREAYH